jgi:hypothetical protein
MVFDHCVASIRMIAMTLSGILPPARGRLRLGLTSENDFEQPFFEGDRADASEGHHELSPHHRRMNN